MSLLEVKEAAFAYDENEIFHDISFALEKGQLCCLMGPNGCGKSTLLDCILGIHSLASGSCLVGGLETAAYKPHLLARQLSYVPQIHDRSFPYEVLQIVLMGRTAFIGSLGSPDPEDMRISLEALASVGIEHLADRPYTQISGGEMQLVLLARALVQETPIIIMDEPTAHLDFKNELLFMERMVKLIKEQTVSILLATHSPNQAFYFENQGVDIKVAAINEGRLFAYGLPSQVLTEQSIADIYGIHCHILQKSQEEFGTLRQIVPIHSF
ncbi:MAG: ABC transporter ATP-binding protein [Clostridiales bacterium]